MNREVYGWSLARSFYLALPHFFGDDIKRDFTVIEKLGCFACCYMENLHGRKIPRNFIDALEDVFLGVQQFLEGSGTVHYQLEESGSIVWKKTGALDGGLAAAFSTSCRGDLLEKKGGVLLCGRGSREGKKTLSHGGGRSCFLWGGRWYERGEFPERSCRRGHLACPSGGEGAFY